jgi:hypothetical protein
MTCVLNWVVRDHDDMSHTTKRVSSLALEHFSEYVLTYEQQLLLQIQSHIDGRVNSELCGMVLEDLKAAVVA